MLFVSICLLPMNSAPLQEKFYWGTIKFHVQYAHDCNMQGCFGLHVYNKYFLSQMLSNAASVEAYMLSLFYEVR